MPDEAGPTGPPSGATSSRRRPSVVVVGGGLAGMSAALRAADMGCAVRLLEARPRLGGAAFSFQRGELTVDNGQHVFLRCCDAYRWFLDRVGATGRTTLQPRLDIPVLTPGGRSARLRRTAGVPAPAHLSAALAGYRVLSIADRARAARGALALRMLNPADPSLDHRTLGGYLRSHGQNDAVIDALWGVVATATLNLAPDEASLALAAKVFRTGLLDHASAADIGHATAPLGELHSTAAGNALSTAGVDVVLGARAETVADGPVVRVQIAGVVRELRPDAVVVAVPPRALFALAPAMRYGPAAAASKLGTAPIVNVHVVYDRMVTELPFAAGVRTPVQWVFDRSESSGLRGRRPEAQYLAVTVSAADGVIDVPARVLIDQFTEALAELFPDARRARVLDAFVTRERHATFRQAAGTAALRPGPESGVAGIALAGAWTDTGWPDTMESAVRSGVAAAQHVAALASSDIVEFAA